MTIFPKCDIKHWKKDNSEKYKIMAEFCKTYTNYDLLVNNETKLSYYLELNNIKRIYISQTVNRQKDLKISLHPI